MPPIPTTRVGIRISINKTQADRGIREMGVATNKLRGFTSALDLSFRSLDRTLSLLAIGGLVAATSKFIKMSAELERAELQIAVFTKSLDKVPQEMAKIIRLTDKVPFSINEMTKSFVRLKASGLEPIADEQGEGMLKNIADGVAAFGGNTEIFKRAVIGMQQIAGKGVVSMEELRQQIGEAIPTAMRVMAAEMKISVGELIDQVSRGKIEAIEGLNALSEGLRKAFGGAGEVLKATFLGQIGELEKQITLLSKTLVKDTGALDVFTAGLKLLNQEIAKWREFLTSKEGTEALDRFGEKLFKIGEFVHQMVPPFQSFVAILGTLISTVAGIVGSLPAEIVSGGILGFLIFGRAGLVAGAIFGAFNKEASALISGIAMLMDAIFASAKSFGIDGTIGGGIIGLLIFGKKGALIGMTIGFGRDLINSLSKLGRVLTAWFQGIMINFSTQWTEGIKRFAKLDFDFGAIKAAGEKARGEFWAAFIKKNPELFAKGKGAGKQVGDGVAEGAETGFTKMVANFRKAMADIQKTREEGVKRGQRIRDIGSLSPTEISSMTKISAFLISLEERAQGGGDALAKFAAKVGTKLKDLNVIVAGVTERMEKLTAGDSKLAGYRKELEKLANVKSKIQSLRDSIIDTAIEKNFKKIESQIRRTNISLNKFLVGTPLHMDATAIAVAKVEDRFAGMALRVSQIRAQIEKLKTRSVEYTEALRQLRELEERVAEGQKRAIQQVTKLTEARKAAAAQAIGFDVKKVGFAVGRIGGQNELDAIAEAGFKAQLKILALEKTIARSMTNIRKKLNAGLISPSDAAASLERLEEHRRTLERNSKEFIERAEFNASRFGELMNSVSQSIEDGFADAFESLISRTKTAREVLLDFYAEITRAVVRYLAKEALIRAGISTDSGGGGQGLAKLFEGVGKLFGGNGDQGGGLATEGYSDFAHGGSFRIGGRGGVDNNVLALNGRGVANVSKGETVTVTPEGGGGGDTYQINITATDSRDVARLFATHGQEIIGALRSQDRLNRGMGRRI